MTSPKQQKSWIRNRIANLIRLFDKMS